ncbi:MAG: ATP-binding protein [Parcubacteria group bacterium]|nr:ATP-binding protein [Parcubacteria group bacterium]
MSEKDPPRVIIVTGLAATGKSTLAKHLGERLALPVLSKDAIKERLFDALGWSDRAWSKRMGAAAKVLYDLIEGQLKAGQSFIVETNFKGEFDTPLWQGLLQRFPVKCVQVLCFADGRVLEERFLQRGLSGNRHPGHQDAESMDEHGPILRQGKAEPIGIACDVIEIDTTDFAKVDTDQVLSQVRCLM